MSQIKPIRTTTAKIVTANHLVSGDVIYLDRTGVWQRSLKDAALYADEDVAVRALDTATRRGRMAVGAYLADAKRGLNGPEPLHYREAIRAYGPDTQPHGSAA